MIPDHPEIPLVTKEEFVGILKDEMQRLREDRAQIEVRLSTLEKDLQRLNPEVVDLRIEVASLSEQVSRGNRINLETQHEMREAFKSLSLQNLNILQLLKERHP